MANGMVVRRPGGGGIVIDSTYKTLGLSQILSIPVTAGTTPVTVPIFVGGENVMVACHCSALEFTVFSAAHGSSSATINFLFRGPSGTTSETVTFYVFANPTFGTETYGVKIFDTATGACIFSNFRKPIRVEGSAVPGNSNFVGTAGHVYAPLLLTRYDDITFNNGVIWNIRYSFLQSSGNTILANMRTVRTGPVRRASISGSYLAVDVTNY